MDERGGIQINPSVNRPLKKKISTIWCLNFGHLALCVYLHVIDIHVIEVIIRLSLPIAFLNNLT
jgi:hypothetical protein